MAVEEAVRAREAVQVAVAVVEADVEEPEAVMAA